MKRCGRVTWDGLVMFRGEQLRHSEKDRFYSSWENERKVEEDKK